MSTHAFAIWVTGLPASGKSTIAAALIRKLNSRNIFPLVLESDRMRRILTPAATYSDDERDRFYGQLADIGAAAVNDGVPVIFDATANRKSYRDHARSAISRFVEVYVNSPLALCMARDPKGIYADARTGRSATVPGIQSQYEPPDHPEIVLDGVQPPELNADRIIELLESLGYV
ncbi:MAG: adenylyl-sulfate kinase [Nitrospirota bacterium]|nr:adenylyl-sulfate kinase [Nitrospirota bacterium]